MADQILGVSLSCLVEPLPTSKRQVKVDGQVIKKDNPDKVKIHNNTTGFSILISQSSVCANVAHTVPDGKNDNIQFYNLNVIIVMNHQANPMKAAQFCQWATRISINSGDNCLQLDKKQKSTLWSADWQKEQNYLQNGLICLYFPATQPPRLWGLYPTRNLGGFFVPENQRLAL